MSLKKYFIILTLIVGACDNMRATEGAGWRQIGALDDGMIPFVEVSSNEAKNGAVYRDAINRLCGPGRCAQVGFFLAGDSIPPSGSRRDFFRSGGWANYSPLAVYMGGDFTKWDCERAGKESAPLRGRFERG